MQSRLVGFIALSFVACGGTAPAPESPPKESAREPEATSPGPAGEAKSEAKAPEPSGASGTQPSDLPDAPPAETKAPAAAEIDLDGWASEHQIKVELVSDGCEGADLGDRPADVIWCKHHTQTKKGVVTYTRALYAVRGKSLQKLIELPLAAGPLELEKGARSDAERYHVRLVLERVDEKHVVVKEAPGLDCARADKENEDLKTTSPDVVADFVVATKKVCAARGNYDWAGGTLRKTR